MPTFVVIGAAKSGTTALHHYLGQHPEVFVPAREEPSFFAFADAPPRLRGPGGMEASVNRMSVTDREDYEALFAGATTGQARGDISPAYLYWPGTAERLASLVPDVRLIAVLRHPVDRAHSAFMHARREGKEPLDDFRAALRAEPARIDEGYGFLWRYQDLGRYARQLERYLAVFSPEQVLVCLYDELAADPIALCARVQSFIGVDPSFRPDTSLRHNASGIPRNRAAYRLLGSTSPLGRAARRLAPVVGTRRLKRAQVQLRTRLLQRQRLDPDLRAELLVDWRAEIHRLEEVLGRDLQTWLDPGTPSDGGHLPG